MATTTLTPADWFAEILSQVDAGAEPQAVAARIVTETPMLFSIVLDHLAWEMARAAIAAGSKSRQQYPHLVAEVPAQEAAARASRYAQVYLGLADPGFWRPAVPAATPPATTAASAAEVPNAAAPKEEQLPGLYL
jgi:hypothetical protein